MLNRLKTFLLAAAMVATTTLTAQAFTQGAVGPVSLQTGFPVWWQDDAGLRIGLCLACAPDPVDAANAFSRQVGFGAEAFWWISNAINWTPAGNTANALMEQAMEAAWFGEDAIDGQQLPFARIRVRADVAGNSTECTVTTPYGAFTVPVAAGVRAINYTQDTAGAATDLPAPFSAVLAAVGTGDPPTTNITHFLTLGLPIVKGAVFAGTGANAQSLNAQVSITCNAPGAFGATSTITTSEFDTAGFAFNDGNNTSPVPKHDFKATAVATPAIINLTANDVDVLSPTNVHGINPLAVGLGAAPPFVLAPGDPAIPTTPGMATAQGGRVAKNADGTVTYLPAAAFSGVDTFPYVIQDTGGCISGQVPVLDPHPVSTGNTICLPPAPTDVFASALAIVTVEQATAQAGFRPKLQKWDISGTSSVSALTTTDAAGNPVLFTNLAGIQEVPPRASAGAGDASVTLRTDAVLGQVIDYTLTYTGLVDVQQAHIHSGPVGANGPVNVFLCTNIGSPPGVPAPPACPATAGTVTGTLSAADFIIAGAVETFPQLIAAIQAGNTYVNVHTAAFGGGEIRGQLGRNVVAAFSGPNTASPLLGVTAVPDLAGQTATWTLPEKLDALPSTDRTVTIQTSAGNTVTVPLRLK